MAKNDTLVQILQTKPAASGIYKKKRDHSQRTLANQLDDIIIAGEHGEQHTATPQSQHKSAPVEQLGKRKKQFT